MRITGLTHDSATAPVDNPGVRRITERIQFLGEEGTKRLLKQHVRSLEDAGVLPVDDENSPKRVTEGWILRECLRRHLDKTVKALQRERAPKKRG